VNSAGKFVILRKTAAKRLKAKLENIKQEMERRMHEPVRQVGEWLERVVRGYYQYHAVPGNLWSLRHFRESLCWKWRQVLRRRSQQGPPAWSRLRRLFRQWIPFPQILHPYPSVRFDARIQGRSRVR